VADSRSGPARTAPELSALVNGLPTAFDEACEQAALIDRIYSKLGLSAEPVLRVRGDVLDRHRGHVETLAATVEQPLLVDRRPTADWLVRLDFQTLSADEPITTPTVLIDDTAADGLAVDSISDPAVVRSLPAGAIERTLAAVCFHATGLPDWLAPVQVRLVPIDPSAHLEYCEQLADQLPTVRLDIDDRDIAVRERLSAADEAGALSRTFRSDPPGDPLIPLTLPQGAIGLPAGVLDISNPKEKSYKVTISSFVICQWY
jgi:threonyl-tRNA synthetase